MNPQEFERMCSRVGLMQEARVAIRDNEILIADGECNAVGKEYLLKNGAIHVGQFPDGLFLTVWSMAHPSEYLFTGNFLIIDKNHNKEFDDLTRKRLRVDTAIENAIHTIEMMRAARAKPN